MFKLAVSFIVLIAIFGADELIGQPSSTPAIKKTPHSSAAIAPDAARKLRVYVWDFKTNLQGQDRLRAKQLSDEFETVLIQSGNFDVLERKSFAALLTQEAAETDLIARIPDAARTQLRKEQADGVIFGDVFEDVSAGEILVTISIQTFEAKKLWQDTRSLKKDELFVQANRMAVARALLPLAPSGSAGGSPQGLRTAKKLANGFLFDLQGCTKSSPNIVCTIEITNNEDQRDLELYPIRALDEESREATAERLVLAGRGGSYSVNKTLASRAPASLEITLSPMGRNSAILRSLEIGCRSQTNFSVVFRNILVQYE